MFDSGSFCLRLVDNSLALEQQCCVCVGFPLSVSFHHYYRRRYVILARVGPRHKESKHVPRQHSSSVGILAIVFSKKFTDNFFTNCKCSALYCSLFRVVQIIVLSSDMRVCKNRDKRGGGGQKFVCLWRQKTELVLFLALHSVVK